MRASVLAVCAMLAVACVTFAQESTPETAPPSPRPTPSPGLPEVVVVTPCRGCLTSVMNSPAAVSVVNSDFIAAAPDRNVGELLRTVPGTNVARLSVREWDISIRRNTSTVASSVLGLVDGRSIYLDFLGIIAWDLSSVDPGDIDRIEVVRGPASAVWGANALNGVVNIITRSPRDAESSSIVLNGSVFDRSTGSTVDAGPGFAYGGSASLSRALNERVAYRLSGGYSASEPFARPVGTLPILRHPLDPSQIVGGGTLPADSSSELGDYKNEGTTQPRADFRLDQELGSGRISYSGGIAGSAGIAHTGLGPFALEEGSHFGYGRVAYSRNLLRIGAFVNIFGVQAPSLLALGADKQPVFLDAHTRSYDLDLSHSRLVGTKNILTYGGNVRRDTFSLSVAPNAKDRTDVGGYVQDEIFVEPGAAGGPETRLILGARLDKFGSLDGLLFSPRVSVIWKPWPNHSWRLSFNKAFRSPSVINNYFDVTFLTPVDLNDLLPNLPPELKPIAQKPFALVQRAEGQEALREDSLTSYELGYIGTLGGKTTLGFNVYVNDTHNNINFTRLNDKDDHYSAVDPPPGWPLPASLLTDLEKQDRFLARTTLRYQNLGPLRRKGIELFLEHRFEEGLTAYFNYSWQPEADPLDAPAPYPRRELSIPPRTHVNAGVYWVGRRLTGSLTVNYVDRAFWVDVIPHVFDGYTPAYTTFNGSIGARWARDRVAATLRVTNMTNVDVQEHVYGDILKRTFLGEVRLGF